MPSPLRDGGVYHPDLSWTGVLLASTYIAGGGILRTGLELKHAKAGVSGAGSGGTGVPPSEPPGYATHGGPKPNAKLQ
jgi:hypothetical protein